MRDRLVRFAGRLYPASWRHRYGVELEALLEDAGRHWRDVLDALLGAVACPPKGGLLSRGFDPAGYPTEPLGSYHVLPTTTWMDPPSTGDLRRWGALLKIGWPVSFASPKIWSTRPDALTSGLCSAPA